MIEKFAGQIRGVGRRVRPRPDKRFIPPAFVHPADEAREDRRVPNHTHLGAVLFTLPIRIALFGGFAFWIFLGVELTRR